MRFLILRTPSFHGVSDVSACILDLGVVAHLEAKTTGAEDGGYRQTARLIWAEAAGVGRPNYLYVSS